MTQLEGPPVALCCCGTPLVTTLEVPKKEWYCTKCKKFYEWLHARVGDGPNPTQQLIDQAELYEKQYLAERRARDKAAT